MAKNYFVMNGEFFVYLSRFYSMFGSLVSDIKFVPLEKNMCFIFCIL